MGGGDGNLKHVVQTRVHLERHQPAARKRLGYLEKHKDYVKRAKDYHKKEKEIQRLHRKAAFKNEDEFAWGMMSHQIQNGRTKKKGKNLSSDEMRLIESQDATYVKFREHTDNKGVEKRLANLHFLDAERPNKHTFFVDDDDLPGNAVRDGTAARDVPKLQDCDVAALLDTHPALLGRKANRLRRSQLDKVKVQDSTVLKRATKLAYKDLYHRQERAKQLGKVREELELRQHLRTKGRRKKVVDAVDGRPAQYKWAAERKR
mmetsp:Transcript_25626/g.85562  ORF Transcript_25626/g.85562 Transcript_25626/m.85562 type:complete len:261 (-) Transcript_25626:58-840(-)|eukprot:CAMPEP_0203966932 /NCGR_PEP_ID=MMETSP0359-20131031/96041_1 /ASSEMBLY_ACC=CAM_ASM_000338 /TAXON_ID=268821 /ORGANISM="Scrippsiella Hangoei, Strain SHTV-5" /LENGTH=260 /DNA_ID=CAMNT_0050904555 /DNA_START=68 /DNA_END=850 /DNA_ORIENTATION=-